MIYATKLKVSQDNIAKDIKQYLRPWTDAVKYVITHNDHSFTLSPDANGNRPKEVSFTGTDEELLNWVKKFPHKYGAIYVVSNSDVVYDMEEEKPNLVFYTINVHNDSINLKEQIFTKLRSLVKPGVQA